MAWKNVTPMEEIIQFVMLAQSARFTVTELCEQFGISRKTGYKHLARYAGGRLKGLATRSHRPHQFPQRTDAAVEGLILAERRLHRTWGPKKLHKVLEVKHGIESPPARSTIGEILRRHGLSVQRRRKPGMYSALNDGLTVPTRPNHVWTADFKGWFLLGNGERCDPLTVCDRQRGQTLSYIVFRFTFRGNYPPISLNYAAQTAHSISRSDLPCDEPGYAPAKRNHPNHQRDRDAALVGNPKERDHHAAPLDAEQSSRCQPSEHIRSSDETVQLKV
jgi:transposase